MWGDRSLDVQKVQALYPLNSLKSSKLRPMGACVLRLFSQCDSCLKRIKPACFDWLVISRTYTCIRKSLLPLCMCRDWFGFARAVVFIKFASCGVNRDLMSYWGMTRDNPLCNYLFLHFDNVLIGIANEVYMCISKIYVLVLIKLCIL